MDINTCLATTAEYRTLALYAHLIPALATIILGLFAFSHAQNRTKAGIFFAFTLTFALWLVADLLNWTTNSYTLLALTWAPLDYINIVFFLLLFYFVYVDLLGTAIPSWLRGVILVAAGIPFFITFSGNAVYEFNQPVCEMIGNDFLADYKVSLEFLVLFATFALGSFRIFTSWKDRTERIRATLISGSIVLFLGVFSIAEYQSVATEVYEIMLYALFSLPIFILILTLAITTYGTFKLGDAAVRVLFYIFLVLAATQFFFVSGLIDFLLAAMSFIVVLTLGIMLFMSSEREIRQRNIIQSQADILEKLNKQQEGLLRFISHEVKGYLTKGQAAFAGIAQGDYGATTPALQHMAENAVIDARKGVDMVADILDASNLRKGTVSYAKAPFDFKASVEQVVRDLTPSAEAKGIIIAFTAPSGSYMMEGDGAKLRRHVMRNLIDNSIHYTPKGEIKVALSRADNRLRFSVKDTGVGITKEDMQRLFTEGGHGKESTKVNIDSTGYGLFIAKQITEAHGGTIQAFSKGPGEGSEFVVELPL